jgi:proline racemase
MNKFLIVCLITRIHIHIHILDHPMADSQSLWGSGTRTLTVTDLHAAGEPARVVLGGLPHFPGDTMADKRRHIMQHADHFRKLLLQEPRGYPCQNANLVLPVGSKGPKDASFGFVILEQGKVYPMMSGHNTICVATALLECGMVPMAEESEEECVDDRKVGSRLRTFGTTRFTLEAPAGAIPIVAKHSSGKVANTNQKN